MSSTLSPAHVDALFTPFALGELKLANRFVMAPMTRNFSPDGIPGPDVAEYYARRAENGVGLIITEGTTVDHPAAASSPTVPRFHGERALAGWAHVAERVHAAGGRIIPQLWHVGLDPQAGDLLGPGTPLIGPSGLVVPGSQVTVPMTEQQIADVVDAFARAAADARRLGFDGIELHAGHGYLIDQFFWAGTNRRTDRYGGDLVARTRFAAEIVEACRRAVGPDFPIVLRISQWKTADFDARLAETPQELDRFLAPLTAAGVDAYHCSTRRFWTPEFDGSDLNLAGWVRKLTGRPTITVGSVGLDDEFLAAFTQGKGAGTTDLDGLLHRLAQDEFDLVAVGRALLADPAWVAKVRDGRMDEHRPFGVEALGALD